MILVIPERIIDTHEMVDISHSSWYPILSPTFCQSRIVVHRSRFFQYMRHKKEKNWFRLEKFMNRGCLLERSVVKAAIYFNEIIVFSEKICKGAVLKYYYLVFVAEFQFFVSKILRGLISKNRLSIFYLTPTVQWFCRFAPYKIWDLVWYNYSSIWILEIFKWRTN